MGQSVLLMSKDNLYDQLHAVTKSFDRYPPYESGVAFLA